MGRRDEKSEPWAVESREALRTALIGQPWLAQHLHQYQAAAPLPWSAAVIWAAGARLVVILSVTVTLCVRPKAGVHLSCTDKK